MDGSLFSELHPLLFLKIPILGLLKRERTVKLVSNNLMKILVPNTLLWDTGKLSFLGGGVKLNTGQNTEISHPVT